jgi:hypothetical protein
MIKGVRKINLTEEPTVIIKIIKGMGIILIGTKSITNHIVIDTGLTAITTGTIITGAMGIILAGTEIITSPIVIGTDISTVTTNTIIIMDFTASIIMKNTNRTTMDSSSVCRSMIHLWR